MSVSSDDDDDDADAVRSHFFMRIHLCNVCLLPITKPNQTTRYFLEWLGF